MAGNGGEDGANPKQFCKPLESRPGNNRPVALRPAPALSFALSHLSLFITGSTTFNLLPARRIEGDWGPAASFHFTLSLSFLVQPGCASAHIKFSRNLRASGECHRSLRHRTSDWFVDPSTKNAIIIVKVLLWNFPFRMFSFLLSNFSP